MRCYVIGCWVLCIDDVDLSILIDNCISTLVSFSACISLGYDVRIIKLGNPEPIVNTGHPSKMALINQSNFGSIRQKVRRYDHNNMLYTIENAVDEILLSVSVSSSWREMQIMPEMTQIGVTVKQAVTPL